MGRFSKYGSRNVVLIFNIGTCKMELSIIIVNYKTPILTHRCIESIYQSKTSFNFEIIVVDNFSQDDSEKIITKDFPEVKWINNTYNAGFGRANNLGVSYAKGDVILFLNSDAKVEADTLEISYKTLLQNKDIGILSCQILNEDGSKQNYTNLIASYKKKLERNILLDYLGLTNFKFKNNAVMGSFMMLRKDIFIKIGGFDPDFFMYSEEIELCNRFLKNKLNISVIDTVSIIHQNGGSTSDRTWANRQSYLSEALLFFKVHGFVGFIFFHIILQFNFITNFIFMWFLNSQYRVDYIKDLKNYTIVLSNSLKIPLLFHRKIGNGTRLLKYEMKK